VYKNLNVLIVDDSDMSRFAISKMVRTIGFSNITFANNGVVALEKVCNARAPFDFIFLDWNMPVLNGIDFLKKLKEIDEVGAINGTHVLMVTSESSTPQILDAISHGASDYIVKPVKIEVLNNKITNLLKKKSGVA